MTARKKTPPKKKVGRRPLLVVDPDLKDRFIAAVKLGMTIEDSAVASGMSRPTYNNYQIRAEAGESPFVEFFAELKEAQLIGKREKMQAIMDAAIGEMVTTVKEKVEDTGKKDKDGNTIYRVIERSVERKRVKSWQAAAWLLERRHPKEFARIDKHAEIEEPGGDDIEQSGLDDAEVCDRLVSVVAEARAIKDSKGNGDNGGVSGSLPK